MPAVVSPGAELAAVLEDLGSEPASLATAMGLLDTVERSFHARASEWIFLRELKVGAGVYGGSAQRLDAFALNCLAHNSMRRICYEVKVSRADYLCEIKQPLKRRIGLRYSNEFYFLTPPGLLSVPEIPIECGLIEIGEACRVVVPAPWRETPGPTWQFLASMLRNQRRSLHERPPKSPNQQRLPFGD